MPARRLINIQKQMTDAQIGYGSLGALSGGMLATLAGDIAAGGKKQSLLRRLLLFLGGGAAGAGAGMYASRNLGTDIKNSPARKNSNPAEIPPGIGSFVFKSAIPGAAAGLTAYSMYPGIGRRGNVLKLLDNKWNKSGNKLVRVEVDGRPRWDVIPDKIDVGAKKQVAVDLTNPDHLKKLFPYANGADVSAKTVSKLDDAWNALAEINNTVKLQSRQTISPTAGTLDAAFGVGNAHGRLLQATRHSGTRRVGVAAGATLLAAAASPLYSAYSKMRTAAKYRE